MTLFGKIVFISTLLIVGGGAYYAVISYVSNDNQSAAEEKAAVVVPITESAQEVASSSPVATSSINASATSSASTSTSTKKIPFSQFIKQSGSYKCSVVQSVAQMSTTGVVYLDNGMVKAEFAVSVAGQSLKTYMIAKDGFTYTWTSNDLTKGYKTKIAQAKGDTSTQSKGTITWDGSQIGDYSCEDWKADASMFVLPKTITFVTQ